MQTFARSTSDLDDSQVLGLYHDLLGEGAQATNGQSVDVEQWRRHVSAVRERFDSGEYHVAPGCVNPRRRLEQALEETPLAERVYANTRIVERARRASQAHQQWLRRYTSETGQPVRFTQVAFTRAYVEAGASRTLSASESFVNAWRANPDNANMPVDRRSLYAYEAMELQRDLLQSGVESVPAVQREVVTGSTAVRELGYDPISGRCEVMLASSDRVYAYRLSPEQWQELSTADSVGAAYVRLCRNNPDAHYENQQAADAAAVRRRCGDCGQFASTDHACPLEGVDLDDPQAVMSAIRSSDALRPVARAAGRSVAADVLASPDVLDLPLQHTQRYYQEMRNDPDGGLHAPRIEMRVPAATNIRSAVARAREVRIPVQSIVTPNELALTPADMFDGQVVTSEVVGTVSIERRADASLTADVTLLRCTCGRFTADPSVPCSHILRVGESVRALAAGDRTGPTRVTRAQVQTAVEQVRAEMQTNEQSLVGEPIGQESNPPVPDVLRFTPLSYGFEEDHAAFQEIYSESRSEWASWREARENGVMEPSPVPFISDGPAFGGVIAVEGDARTFGTELEFSFPEGMGHAERRTSLAQIGRELYELGLTESQYQQPYGASHGVVRRQHERGWSFEEDPTTGGGGEIVSPVMHDSAETWQNMQKVCEVLQRNGAVASRTPATGCHVHVGVGDYGRNVDRHARLVASMKENEDVVYRLSTNPVVTGRPRHRPLGYCAPNPEPAPGFREVAQVTNRHWGHHIGLNMQSVSGRDSDHVEFRTFDASLDPGVIQAQIGAAVYMADDAMRNEQAPTMPRPESTVRLGDSLASNSSRERLTGDAWKEQAAPFRKFLDRFVPGGDGSDVRVKQIVSVFAGTRWGSNGRRR